MKNLRRISALALLLTGMSFAQQEVSPDHFEAAAAKPVTVKQARSQSKAHPVQTKHHVGNKSGNKTVVSARNVAGN